MGRHYGEDRCGPVRVVHDRVFDARRGDRRVAGWERVRVIADLHVAGAGEGVVNFVFVVVDMHALALAG